jgi:hypothetical protein
MKSAVRAGASSRRSSSTAESRDLVKELFADCVCSFAECDAALELVGERVNDSELHPWVCEARSFGVRVGFADAGNSRR